MRFSETGPLYLNLNIVKGLSFFKDFMSKHAIHSDVAYEVRYAGEFHIRPSKILNNYKLIIDNNSGTYGPDKKYLSLLE